jgi:ABC-type transporter Mla MlaB component
VLNNAQIASIKERLKLSSYQNQLWPPVESALRDISYQGHADASGRKLAAGGLVSGGHGATIDPNSASVQRLKSAAFPLLMSLSEDQKQEVRTMVRLMGLENLASQF